MDGFDFIAFLKLMSIPFGLGLVVGVLLMIGLVI